MVYAKRLSFEPVREAAFGSITGSYTALGPPLSHNVRLVCITNTTDVDVYISIDAINNHLRIVANSFKLLDVTANMVTQNDDAFLIAVGTQFYVKQTSLGAPSKGLVFIEVVIAVGGGS